MVGYSYTFIGTTTGRVIWQHGYCGISDPLAPKEGHIAKILHYFPRVNEPINDQRCNRTATGPVECTYVSEIFIDHRENESDF